MKKKCILFSVLAIMLLIGTMVLASAEDYTLFLDHNLNVFKGVPITTEVKLIGNNAPAYPKVRVKVDISGPATPKLMATDSEGNEWDIAQIGYWGPETGFAVGGTFTNTTPVTATFPEAGLYEITLSLVDVSQPTSRATDSNVIASSKESIYVYRDQAELDAILAEQNRVVNNTNVADSNVVGNNMVENAPVENLPQTGTSIAEYAIYTGIIFVICLVGYAIIKNYRIKM